MMQESSELKNLIHAWAESMAKGDVAFIESVLSRQADVLWIGTDPMEWWSGYDNIVRVFKAQTEEMGAGSGLQFLPGDIKAHSDGDVGWTADQLTVRFPNGHEVAMRLTAVWRREDSAWKIVQVHSSIGVPNEEAIGSELTV